jgi:hypothetical protein
VINGKMPGIGGDKQDRPLASVHRLDPDRPRREASLPDAQAAPKAESSAPDRNAGLSMLGTLDLDDVELRSPDEILASLEPSGVSGPGASAKPARVDRMALASEAATSDGAQSDEILR